jgi:hypothetical protein
VCIVSKSITDIYILIQSCANLSNVYRCTEEHTHWCFFFF